jgi:hypothetical protein
MSIAYVILAHRNPDQLKRLLNRLTNEEARAFVHIDAKTDLAPFAVALAPLMRDGRVQLARRRLRSHWADYGLVAATLATVEQALEEFAFSHVSLLSGDAYPLASAEALSDFFAGAADRSFMFYSAGDDGTRPPAREGNKSWYWNGDLRRVTYRHYRLLGRQLHLPNRYLPRFPRLIPPSDLTLYQGSQWWTLSREAARYVVETFIRRPELGRYFRRTQAPDEFAFQTVLCNSHLQGRIVNDDLHFIQWEGWHPRTLTLDDLPALASSQKLFARKLSTSSLMDNLDRLCHEDDRKPQLLAGRLERTASTDGDL